MYYTLVRRKNSIISNLKKPRETWTYSSRNSRFARNNKIQHLIEFRGVYISDVYAFRVI